MSLPPDLERRKTALHAIIERTKRREGQKAKPAARLLDSTGPIDKQ